MPILDQLLKSCVLLMELAVLAPQVWEALHIRHQVGLALVSILIEQETGAIIDIRLTICSSVPPKTFLLFKVTTLVIEASDEAEGLEALVIEASDEAEGLEALVLEGLGKFHEVRTLEIKSPRALFFSSLLAVQKAMLNRYVLTGAEIWELNNNTKLAFDLSLTQLDISQRPLQSSELSLLAGILEVSPAVRNLTLLVPAVHEAFNTLQKIIKRLKARTTLNLTLRSPHGSGALIEFEETSGHIVAVDLRLPKDSPSVSPTTDQDSSDYTGSLTALQIRRLLGLPDIALRATINNPFLGQVKVLNGDQPPIVYNIPIIQLRFGCQAPNPDLNPTIRQSDGAKTTISFKNPVESLRIVADTLQLPRTAAALTLLDDAAPLTLPFSILRMSNEVFGSLVDALNTALVDLSIQHIDITDTVDTVLVSFEKPTRILDFGSVAVTKEDLPRLKRILELTAFGLSKLELSVDSVDESLHSIFPVLRTLKLPLDFTIKRMDGTKVLFRIKPDNVTVALTSVILQLSDNSSTTRAWNLDRRGVDNFFPRPVFPGFDGILELKELKDPELRFFATVQQLVVLRPGRCTFDIKDARDKLLLSIAIPVLKANLLRTLSEEDARAVERLLAYRPLLSEASVTVDNFESAVMPFLKELPKQLMELSRLSVRQIGHDTMVSFFKQTDKSTMETIDIQQQFDGIKIQTCSLLPTSNLLELKHVKELILLSSHLNDFDVFSLADEEPEIMVTVATVMKKFPELQMLEIQCHQTNFGSLRSSLAALSETELGLRFDLYLTDGVK
ncbi:hypothetical protein BGX24_005964 [Mortierella sp. AD032]|nr:hypothetical protein BGX24_005964 [Mortierella sp. AD032]